ncbi:MAG: hypothetical protein DRN88_01715 [Candidatus Hydrothermarchaeota archaeon]|nr:MAG: hypothetical protein DRN88_01715 [Candidatus Hydrothermarchaeota archaeon]
MHIAELYDYGIPKQVIEILEEQGYRELYPPQELAIKQGLLELKNSFVISVPTASGKTLIAELFMLRSLLERGGKCLYIVPLKALASEKAEDFRKYEKLGIKVAISTGDYDSSDSWLADYDIIVTTSEKADSLLRHSSPWLREVKVVVADEIHLINDAKRGPTLEITLAKLRHINPEMLILGLSATINNAEDIASWLSAKLIKSNWRPVILKEGVYYNGEIFFNGKSKKVENLCKEEVVNLALEVVNQGGQALVFLSTRASAESFALRARKYCKKFLSEEEKKELKELSQRILKVLAEPTRICKRLSKCVEEGTAFHHAGLASEQRKMIEHAFRENKIKILSATPTLAAGVNLPARRVIIRDYSRYESELGRVKIPVLEYKQMAGRAGRPKYDSYGEALLVAKSYMEKEFLMDNYILAEPEAITSKLAIESMLRTHVLSVIATGYAHSFEELLEFFSKTFLFNRFNPSTEDYSDYNDYYIELLEKTVEFLIAREFCVANPLSPTKFGRRVSELYIDPITALAFKEGLERAKRIKTNEFSYLHLLTKATELKSLYLRKKDYDLCETKAYENEAYLLFDIPDEYFSPYKYEGFLSEIKTALFFIDWINERSEEYILEKYNLAPGDIRSKIEIADWLLYAMQEIGKLFNYPKLEEIAKLRLRVKHGVKEELLELISLRGVGRVRARKLYARGYKTLKDIRKASIEELASIELIGEKIAKRMKEQAYEKIK